MVAFTAPAGTVIAKGNLYIADTGANRIEEVPARSGMQWGIPMIAGRTYTIAGSPDGVAGLAGDGGPASAALLNAPEGIAADHNGDLYIADAGNNRVQMIAASSETPLLAGTVAGDIYTVAGSADAHSGHKGDGGPATSAELANPIGLGEDRLQDLYIADFGNNRVQEVPAVTGTQWGVAMSAGRMYTVAGSAEGGFGVAGDGGLASQALLQSPTDVSLSAGGDLYIADFGNNRVQEVCAATGACGRAFHVHTVAGSADGSPGRSGDGGRASAALLNNPWGVRVHDGGNLYITDLGNSRIEEVADRHLTEWGIAMSPGDIYTIAGNLNGRGGFSGDGGLATKALLNGCSSLTFDSSGDLYFADTTNDRIREVSASSGDISDAAGNGDTLANRGDGGPALAASLMTPDDVATDGAGNVYIADSGNNRIQEIAGSTHTQWGIAMTAGDVYTIAGSPAGAAGDGRSGELATHARLDSPIGVAVDPSGDVYIADTINNRIEEVAAASGTQWGIAMQSGHMYTIAGNALGQVGNRGDGGLATRALLNGPWGVTVDAAGDLYIVDTGNNQIREVARQAGQQWGIAMRAGHIYTVAGNPAGASGFFGDGWPATVGLLAFPTTVALDPSGDLYVADAANNRIQEVAAHTGAQWGMQMKADAVYTIAGDQSATAGITGDGGAATSALLNDPIGITIDRSGNLYVADSANNRIQEIAASDHTQWGVTMTAGDIYTVAGSAAGTPGYRGDGGPATAALLEDPLSISTDQNGDLYLTDVARDVVREVTASG